MSRTQYQWNWQQFCGQRDPFVAWTEDDFSRCFEQVAIICPTHVLLAVASVFYFAQCRARFGGSAVHVSWTWFLVLRFLMCACLVAIPLVQVVIQTLALHASVSISDSLTVGITALTWLLHGLLVWNLRHLHSFGLRGPTTVIVLYFLTLASAVVHTRSVALQHLHQTPGRNEVVEYSTYVTLAIQVVYLLSLIPNPQREYSTALFSGAINYDSPDTERLTWDHVHSYGGVGTQNPAGGLPEAEEGANWLSLLSFHWVQPLMHKGAKMEIQDANDLFQLPKKLKTESLNRKFAYVLRQEVAEHSDQYLVEAVAGSYDQHEESDSTFVAVRNQNTQKRKGPLSLLRVLMLAFGKEYFLLGGLKLVTDCLGFAGPLLLNLLVLYIEDQQEPTFHGYLYALGMFSSTLLSALFSTQFNYHVQNVGYKIRCAIITTVYRKSLAVNTVSMSKFSSGEVVNFMSTDSDRIVNFCPSFHAFWSLPFQIAISLFLLHQQVGLAFLAGVAFALVLIPINRQLAIKIGELSKDMMEHKDSRVKLMNEILSGIRVVKFYAWEDHFTKKIQTYRDAELKSLKGRKYLDALCVYFWATTPVLISILTFSTYVLMGNKLTAAKVFTSLSLFVMLISPLNAFPWVINGLMEAWVSLKRVQEFIRTSDLDLNKYYSAPPVDAGDTEVVCISLGNFTWTPPCHPESDIEDISRTLQLTDINLSINKGQFVGVIGRVGSGKTSLLNAILSEMHRSSGSISLGDLGEGFALVAQESWVQHATLRDNILFGRKYSARHYESVLEACALLDDLKVLPAADLTEIGESGVTLSGGQKARVALARAVYQDKAVYLLDDPLAAVDAHVAMHLYSRCIMGLLRDKTRVLCTHHTKFLAKADLVILMEDGKIAKAGRPEDILPSVEQMLVEERKAAEPSKEEGEGEEGEGDGDARGGGELVQEEEREEGSVHFLVYKGYWAAVGAILAPAVLISLFFMQASRNINDWWLSYWVSHSHEANTTVTNASSSLTDTVWTATAPVTNGSMPWRDMTYAEDNVAFYLTVYGSLAAANSVFTLLRAFLFALGGICAAQVLHKNLLSSVLKAPTSFFDTTPLGRIVNRFSSDLYSIDDALPFMLNIFMAQSFGIVGSVIVTCCGLPWFILILVPLTLLYYKIQHYYRHTSREVKRISSVTLSPIYAHFSETIAGVTTIRAMRAKERFQRENLTRLDLNQRAQFANTAVARWLDFRLQMLGVAMVTGVALIAVLEHHFRAVNPGLVGLAISYSLSITGLLSGVVTSFTETEKQFVSVERVLEYTEDTPSEAWDGMLFPPPYWPIQGAIQFQNVRLRYRPGLPDALDNVTLETQPAEKVGVVGRTGSGKSSLFLSLFRMVEIHEGQILIDGINLRHLDLKDVRSRLAIIPQDPFLFSGTVRENLDPTESFRDGELWMALDKCHLRVAVERLGGLSAQVSEKGRVFSLGQRQLLCLARALLTNTKVLCIDEATASVDLETDQLIQQTLRTEFASSTVITIAHRINTIMDSDRILVMQNGQVTEFAPPQTLLQNPKSLFYQLVHGTSE